ncbi:AraC family transcriptional regulator [Rubellicoccus peritrichatus]|uniref:AraC family transcriptional regulator n=1 Tax=Rubellicoccus peritrichatus TaxID=3080537 RepID=A0AAQ3L9Y8_9BACT|nr:AraC family transcriptional regulator [Puniceicoccus sp. CR14]WOO39598.1 AraC family transcriptional regulator [Puniceicoccus sp. CR14]
MKHDLDIGVDKDGMLFSFSGLKPGLPHTHDELEFNLALKGQGHYLVSGRKYRLQPFSLIWLFPDEEHILYDVSDDFNMWIVVFKQSMLQAACKEIGNLPLLNSSAPEEIIRTVKPVDGISLNTLCEETLCQEDQIDLFNASLRFLLLKAWQSFQSVLHQPLHETLHPAIFRTAMLLKEGEGDEDISTISKNAGLSESHLSRLFHAQIGMSLTDYRNQQRLQRFTELFQFGKTKSMLEAALEAGFGSYAQFHRVFTQQMGASPSEHYKEISRQAQ